MPNFHCFSDKLAERRGSLKLANANDAPNRLSGWPQVNVLN
jgi:hypothetical protein